MAILAYGAAVNCLEAANGWGDDVFHYAVFGKRLRLLIETICKQPFCLYCVYYLCFVQWGGWEVMNKPDLQLINLLGYSCTCRYATFVGESIQRVGCVASFSGCHLAFCCLLHDKWLKAGGRRHAWEWGYWDCSWRVFRRVSHIPLFPDFLKVNCLIHYWEDLVKFYTINMNCWPR